MTVGRSVGRTVRRKVAVCHIFKFHFPSLLGTSFFQQTESVSLSLLSVYWKCHMSVIWFNNYLTKILVFSIIFALKGKFVCFFYSRIGCPPVGELNLMVPKNSFEVKFFTRAYLGAPNVINDAGLVFLPFILISPTYTTSYHFSSYLAH